MSTVRKLGELDTGAQLAFFLLSRISTHGVVPLILKVSLSSPVNSIWKFLLRHAPNLVSKVILDPAILTININDCSR